MTIHISSTNVTLTDEIKQFIEKKTAKLNQHGDQITRSQITLHEDNLLQIAELQVHIPGHTLHAKAEAEKIHAAIDSAIDKMLKQLHKYREKQTDHRGS
jgi:putative sigma-54 modulation protein